ncbi:MAG: phytoene/squalene synthase family protein [Mycobacteriales bacterium]
MSLDAAGITDPVLRASYQACRRLNARYGRTYYLATWLLPPAKRPYVHALYGYARHADDLVDLPAGRCADDTARLVRQGADALRPAFEDTLRRWDIDPLLVQDFLRSMSSDLHVSSYKTWEDLQEYVHGSAAVIGLQMLPILGTVVPREVAAPYAVDLGIAFQLTNFLRDVGEDLRRGRLYLPLEDLDAFGVSREQLEAGIVDGRVRRLLAFEIARARELYRTAALGIRLLEPSSRPCIATAHRLYGAILDEIERADYPVLHRRVAVGPALRARVAVPGLVRAVRSGARRRDPRTPTS